MPSEPLTEGGTQPAGPGRLRFEGVHLSLGGREVLRGIDLTVEPGTVVAIVGPTGAGKSTLVSLILRFFDPWSGRVTLDGRDVRDVTLASLRSQVSLVLQEPFLLPLSVAAATRPSRANSSPRR